MSTTDSSLNIGFGARDFAAHLPKKGDIQMQQRSEHLADLKPTQRRRLIDLVEEAGLDVSDWADFARGKEWAAANPKYCYEWSFLAPGRVVILNLWHAQMVERRGEITLAINMRSSAARHVGGGAHAVWRRRAANCDLAIREASEKALPVRAIINDGIMGRSGSNAKASVVKRRYLDPLPWAVTSYNARTGQAKLTRGEIIRGSVDQFDVPSDETNVANRERSLSSRFVRDRVLRAGALRRANGLCEFCKRPGFTMLDGRVYLETHHVVPLSEGGLDSADNIVAICPNHHREAHHGASALLIRESLITLLKTIGD